MKPNDELRPEPRPESRWIRGDGIDELLGVDPTPLLSSDAVRAIHEHLQRENDGALDGLLGLDDVSVPDGLADRVLARVDSERDAAGRRRRFRALPPVAAGVALVAAATLAIVLLRGGDDDRLRGGDHNRSVVDDGAFVADASDEQPSDEFLAALSALEDLEFLTEELDPFEADALFLMDADDALLLDLLEMGG